MPEYKWTQIEEVSLGSEYIAFTAMGERTSIWSFFSFLMGARAMQKQLAEAKGLIGYQARLEFLGKKVVMLAVFKDEASLNDFAHSGKHAHCMEKTKPALKAEMKYARWRIAGSDVPPKLEDAISRFENGEGR